MAIPALTEGDFAARGGVAEAAPGRIDAEH